AALLADDVLPDRPMRQWVLSLPFALRFLLATDPDALTHVLGIVYRSISGFILKKARLTRSEGDTGTTHVVFEPLDFLARLAALVPPPRIHLTRFHGVFAPASRLRGAVTPARRGRGGSRPPASTEPPAPKHVSMTWMQRLKRVFAIDIDTCQRCGGPLKVIASIEDPELIANILSHLQQRSEEGNDEHRRTPIALRAPPKLPLL